MNNNLDIIKQHVIGLGYDAYILNDEYVIVKTEVFDELTNQVSIQERKIKTIEECINFIGYY